MHKNTKEQFHVTKQDSSTPDQVAQFVVCNFRSSATHPYFSFPEDLIVGSLPCQDISWRLHKNWYLLFFHYEEEQDCTCVTIMLLIAVLVVSGVWLRQHFKRASVHIQICHMTECLLMVVLTSTQTNLLFLWHGKTTTIALTCNNYPKMKSKSFYTVLVLNFEQGGWTKRLSVVTVNGYPFKGVTLSNLFCLASEKRSTLKEKNLLPMGANSFLLE